MSSSGAPQGVSIAESLLEGAVGLATALGLPLSITLLVAVLLAGAIATHRLVHGLGRRDRGRQGRASGQPDGG